MTRIRRSPATTPAERRAALARAGAGVIWCASDGDFHSVDDVLHRIRIHHDRQIVAVSVTYAHREDRAHLHTDVATALGVQPGTGTQLHHLTQLDITAVLLGLGVTDLLLAPAWWAYVDDVEDLVAACRTAGTRLWLLGGPVTDPSWLTTLVGLGAKVSTRDVVDAFSDIPEVPATPTPHPPAAWDSITAIPTTDVHGFLDDVDAMLPADQAALVADHMLTVARTAAAWLLAHPDAEADTIAAQLHAAWQESGSWPQFLTTVRAWQAAAFHQHRHLRVDVRRLAAATEVVPSAATRTPAMWQRLAAASDSRHRAVCALVAAGLYPADVLDTRLHQTALDGSHVTRGGRTWTVEDAARPWLASHVAYRLLKGAGPDDVLISQTRSHEPMGIRWISAEIGRARTDHGLALTGGVLVAADGDARMAGQYGVNVRNLT